LLCLINRFILNVLVNLTLFCVREVLGYVQAGQGFPKEAALWQLQLICVGRRSICAISVAVSFLQEISSVMLAFITSEKSRKSSSKTSE